MLLLSCTFYLFKLAFSLACYGTDQFWDSQRIANALVWWMIWCIYTGWWHDVVATIIFWASTWPRDPATSISSSRITGSDSHEIVRAETRSKLRWLQNASDGPTRIEAHPIILTVDSSFDNAQECAWNSESAKQTNQEGRGDWLVQRRETQPISLFYDRPKAGGAATNDNTAHRQYVWHEVVGNCISPASRFKKLWRLRPWISNERQKVP